MTASSPTSRSPLCAAHAAAPSHRMLAARSHGASIASALSMIALLAVGLVAIASTGHVVLAQDSSSSGMANTTANATIADLNQDTVWGNCKRFSVFGKAGIAFNGASTAVQTGDIGCSPAPSTAITGSWNLGSGSEQGNTAAAVLCREDYNGIYQFLHTMTCPAPNHINPILNGITLLPGVYCAEYFDLSASTLTLDGNYQTDPPAQWVFQTETTLHTSTATHFILINGAKECNVYWALGTAGTVDVGAINFVGQIIAGAAITIGVSVPVRGRVIAGTAVTFAGTGNMNLPPDCNDTPTSNSSTGVYSSGASSSTGPMSFPSSSSGPAPGAGSSTGLSAASTLSAGSLWSALAMLAALIACATMQ